MPESKPVPLRRRTPAERELFLAAHVFDLQNRVKKLERACHCAHENLTVWLTLRGSIEFNDIDQRLFDAHDALSKALATEKNHD